MALTFSSSSGRVLAKLFPTPFFVALGGGALLVYQWAGGRPLWVDEEMLALNLRNRSFLDLAAPLSFDQSAPLGWLALQRLVLLGAGPSEQALRLVPLLFGLGTLGTAAWIGRRWLGLAGGAVLVLLCAFSPWLSYHALELKPYSADAFWGLLLPGLAAWVVERATAEAERSAGMSASSWQRRVALWWGLATIGLWFGNGALLVTPACAVVLHVALSRRYGWRGAVIGAIGSACWLGSFALHYHWALRHTVASHSLQAYWSFAMPPAGAGLVNTGRWLVARFVELADKPVGVEHPAIFWLVAGAGAGVAIGCRPAAGLMLAVVPLSAGLFAALRWVPIYERLSLWILPALYVAVAVLALAGVALGRCAANDRACPGPRRLPGAVRRLVAACLAIAAGTGVGIVSAEVVRNGYKDLTSRPTNDNHRVDDRGGVRWLMKQRQPGDVVLTTHLALPAVWWYGGLPVASGAGAAGGPALSLFEADVLAPGPGCPQPLREQLGQPRRVLVYLGFRLDDWPDAREELLFASLVELGAIAQYRHFAESGGVLIVDLCRPPAPGAPLPARPWTGGRERGPRAPGCLTVRPAASW